MLLDLIKHQIVKQDTQLREAIPVHDRLMVTLRFLASGDAYSSLQYLFRIPPCTIGRIVFEVCQAIYDNLKEKYLKCPSSTEELKKCANQFALKWQFPHCFGAIDGKHITIVAPQNTPHKVKYVTLATCALHNFLISTSNYYLCPGSVDSENPITREIVNGEWRNELQPEGTLFPLERGRQRNYSISQKDVRDEFREYFMTTAGEVQWQYPFIC
ncbi:unnamed protein product [Macrosiphum euphorbiae]|uniref:Nuclease HARBI1 n=1 Tax=Macrosiphum euphorbiae TaxID=13131 RepID=A0AAV0XQB9_9HEMI|nr:unnamed protein product [Macrosiphum euphorbiae]